MHLPVVESTWYSEGLRFTCTQCGNCCTGAPGYVWMSDIEIDRLAEHLKISRAETIERYCRKIGDKISLKERRSPQGNYDCIFLHEERTTSKRKGGGEVVHTKRTCTIYPVRPLQCRTWPFWDGNLASRKSWEIAARGCPGMDRGKHYTREQIEALRDAEDWPASPPTSRR